MTNYEEAYKIAKELKANIDNCTEYEKGFVFGCSDDDNFVGGSGHTPVVVLKENGKAVPMNVFILRGTGAQIREIEITDK